MSSSYIQYYIILFYFIIWEIKWSNGNGPLAGQSDVGLKIIILIGMPESKFHPISPYGCQSGNSKEAFCWWKCSDWCVVFYCSIFFLVLILKNCGLGMQRRCQFFFTQGWKLYVEEKVSTKIQVPLGENEPQNFPADYQMSLNLIWEIKLEAM